MSKFFLGADPGTISGAIAVIAIGDDIELDHILLYKMPLDDVTKDCDPVKLHNIFIPFKGDRIVVEIVRFGSRDDDHKSSAEKLIRSHQCILDCAKLAGLQVLSLETPKWRELAGSLFYGTDEKQICEYASKLYPQAASRLIRPKLKGKGVMYEHNLAEALLMAHAAKLHYEKERAYIRSKYAYPQSRSKPNTHKGIPIE